MRLNKHKGNMRKALRIAVEGILNQYRIKSHREWDKAIEDVREELQSLKHGQLHRYNLITESEFLNTLDRNRKKSGFKFLKKG